MKRRRLITIVIASLLLLGLTPPSVAYHPSSSEKQFGASLNAPYSKQAQGSAHEGQLREAADFLRNIQFNPALNICREAPRVAPNTYWLVSDNLLAYHALEPYYPYVAKAIHDKMREYGYFKDYCHEALFGEKLPYVPFKNATKYLIGSGPDYEIRTEMHNGSGIMEDYMDYADLCLYTALHYHRSGDESEAIDHFNCAEDMWDGKGLNDKVYKTDNLYGTRNLALLLYVARILNQPLEDRAAIENVLWSMQDENGGIHTDYDDALNYEGKSDVNTETTSMTIIAYKYRVPSFIDLKELFIVDGCFNSSFGYGSDANVIDVDSGSLIDAWFASHASQDGSRNVFDNETGSVGEAPGPLISVGGPAVNLFWREYNVSSNWAYFTFSGAEWMVAADRCAFEKSGSYVYEGGSEADVVTDYAIVELVWDEENSRPVLLIAGISGYATKAACKWFHENAEDIISEEVHAFILEIKNYGDGTWISTTVSYTV